MFTPHGQSRTAYWRGFKAFSEGLEEEDNPYLAYSRSNNGVFLSSWWSAGRGDAAAGRQPRFKAPSRNRRRGRR